MTLEQIIHQILTDLKPGHVGVIRKSGRVSILKRPRLMRDDIVVTNECVFRYSPEFKQMVIDLAKKQQKGKR